MKVARNPGISFFWDKPMCFVDVCWLYVASLSLRQDTSSWVPYHLALNHQEALNLGQPGKGAGKGGKNGSKNGNATPGRLSAVIEEMDPGDSTVVLEDSQGLEPKASSQTN